MFIRRLVVLILAAACCSTFVHAGKKAPMDLDLIRTQQQQIRGEVQAGKGRYAKMPTPKRDELLNKQEALLKLIEGKQTDADLNPSQQLQAFNALEWIEASINNTEDERMVCKREKPTGSNRVQKTCRTVAQMRAEREAAEKAVDRMAICSSGNMCTSN